jgi:hypothetical protein
MIIVLFTLCYCIPVQAQILVLSDPKPLRTGAQCEVGRLHLQVITGTAPPFYPASLCYKIAFTTTAEIIKPPEDRISALSSDVGTHSTRLNALEANLGSLLTTVQQDEAKLPSQIDQYAVQKLLDRIQRLEQRVTHLEGAATKP